MVSVSRCAQVFLTQSFVRPVGYPRRARLKIFAHIEEKDVKADPALAERLTLPGYRAKVERALVVHLKAFDWNCPQFITPRFTEAELATTMEAVSKHIADLETENKELKAMVAEQEKQMALQTKV
jgi:hypothetical protein